MDDYTSFNKYFGMGAHFYLDLPDCEKCDGSKCSSSNANFFTMGLTLMPAFNISICDFLDLRIGAGLGFMIVNENYKIVGERVNFDYFMLTFPIGIAAQFKFGPWFGLKTGCDVQFEIKGWYYNSITDSSVSFDKNGVFVNPYVAFTILY